ncbi:hypothetical protein M378DRAFT_91689 [Amanita muscaria Koide BX008]|uniref:Uncharacterized protein n=1 Tax=Amanita muscaria (strain Koide BX008) TaxID=946122 RepID=A0A0C2SLY3_AMAMK|nr:hypothetical protein M378DRAFT_91689 [Amanita muscaria Koide BX008]
MGRPRLHHTAKEKMAANRAKSKRHYERKKSEIQSQRRAKYATLNRISQPLGVLRLEHSKKKSCRSISYWSERVVAIQGQLRHFTVPSLNAYVDGIYSQFMNSGDETLIDKAIANVGAFRKELLECEQNILQLEGVGKRLLAARKISCEVEAVIKYLEEILCFAMTDISELVDKHDKKQLMYQT